MRIDTMPLMNKIIKTVQRLEYGASFKIKREEFLIPFIGAFKGLNEDVLIYEVIEVCGRYDIEFKIVDSHDSFVFINRNYKKKLELEKQIKTKRVARCPNCRMETRFNIKEEVVREKIICVELSEFEKFRNKNGEVVRYCSNCGYVYPKLLGGGCDEN